MKIVVNFKKTLEQNADAYFEAAKKSRKKLGGVKDAMQRLEKEAAKKKKNAPEPKVIAKKRKEFWFEKFRWFISSDGYLCIGGRDATSNEIVIKKHTDAKDIVLHTDMAGSPFVVVKNEQGTTIPKKTLEEAAQFTAAMSRAWRNGLGTLAVFYVKPEQVSKEANAGESLPRGAFMVRGETHYFHPEVKICACRASYEDVEMLMVAPQSACRGKTLKLAPGKDKASDVAKKLQKELLPSEQLDFILRQLPSGGISFEK